MNTVYKFIYPVLAVVILLLIGFLGYTLIESNKDEDTNDSSQDQAIQMKDFTLAQVQEGNTITNCYLAYNGKVFFIPEEYINSIHPGGSKSITNNCGSDVSAFFDDAHDGSRSSISELMEYEVGVLVESSTSSTQETDSTTSSLVAEFTRAEVASANDINVKCMMIYESSVYEIPSSWSSEHPGGSRNITSNCGKDITSQFKSQHNGSQEAIAQLAEYFVGTVKE